MEWSPALWILKHQIKTESGLPVEFIDHRFLFDIYNDLSPLQVILKAPQIGATMEHIVKTMWVAKKLGKDIIYTLPTASDVNDMAGGKINRIVAQNPVLKEWTHDRDTVEQKAIGDNIIYYRGTFTSKQAMMVSSDLNVHDEVDASDPGVITQYETRLQAKAGGWRWYFSHPSLAGHGVDVFWQQSDKKEWFVVCSCGREQILQWPRNIREGNYICASCGQIITDAQRRNGKWLATAEGEFSGYHISQLICPWISAQKIEEAYADPKKDKQYFWNYVLGLPYVGGDDTITAQDVLKNSNKKVNPQEGIIVIGVDTGLPTYVTVGNQEGIFYHASFKPEDNPYRKVEDLLLKWKNSFIVADQGGDLIGIRQLQEKYPGRVFLCFYRKDRKSTEMIQWGTGDNYGTVIVDRNRMIQLMVEQLREGGRITLNGSYEDWMPLAEHFENIYREQIKMRETPNKDDHTLYSQEYVWKRKGDDHLVHALLYCLTGIDRYRNAEVKVVGGDMMGNLPTGRMFYG